jgi:hypothetical protein
MWYTIEATDTAPNEMASAEDRSVILYDGKIVGKNPLEGVADAAKQKSGLPHVRVYKGKSIGKLVLHI